MTNSCLNDLESILGSRCYILNPDLHRVVEALVHCYFGLSLTKPPFLGHLVIITATVHLTWVLADLALISLRKVPH